VTKDMINIQSITIRTTNFGKDGEIQRFAVRRDNKVVTLIVEDQNNIGRS
jgi:hypothetical protein